MAQRNPTSPRVLLVEDDPSVGLTLKLVLRRGGYAPELVASAKEALAIFVPGEFDLVLTDYEMAGMKGDELTAALKARAPSLPVVVITGHLEKLARDGHLAKPDLVLGKPFAPQELLDALREVLARGSGRADAPGQ